MSLTSDRLVAIFDGPGRALDCALALVRLLRQQELDVRIGLHCGEIEVFRSNDVRGAALEIAAGAAALARANEVVATRTVKDPVAGSKVALRESGVHELGAEKWQLFTANEKIPA